MRRPSPRPAHGTRGRLRLRGQTASASARGPTGTRSLRSALPRGIWSPSPCSAASITTIEGPHEACPEPASFSRITSISPSTRSRTDRANGHLPTATRRRLSPSGRCARSPRRRELPRIPRPPPPRCGPAVADGRENRALRSRGGTVRRARDSATPPCPAKRPPTRTTLCFARSEAACSWLVVSREGSDQAAADSIVTASRRSPDSSDRTTALVQTVQHRPDRASRHPRSMSTNERDASALVSVSRTTRNWTPPSSSTEIAIRKPSPPSVDSVRPISNANLRLCELRPR